MGSRPETSLWDWLFEKEDGSVGGSSCIEGVLSCSRRVGGASGGDTAEGETFCRGEDVGG